MGNCVNQFQKTSEEDSVSLSQFDRLWSYQTDQSLDETRNNNLQRVLALFRSKAKQEDEDLARAWGDAVPRPVSDLYGTF